MRGTRALRASRTPSGSAMRLPWPPAEPDCATRADFTVSPLCRPAEKPSRAGLLPAVPVPGHRRAARGDEASRPSRRRAPEEEDARAAAAGVAPPRAPAFRGPSVSAQFLTDVLGYADERRNWRNLHISWHISTRTFL